MKAGLDTYKKHAMLCLQVDGDYIWTDDWPDLYSNWGDDEPGDGEGCVAMEQGGTLSDTRCGTGYPFVCKISTGNLTQTCILLLTQHLICIHIIYMNMYICILVPRPTTPAPAVGACPSEDWEEWGNLCFYFTTEIQTWDHAQARCTELAGEEYPSASLASIHNEVTNNWIYEHVQSKIVDSAWIGLRENISGVATHYCFVYH